MNAKQTAPIIATLAPVIAAVGPPVLVIGGIFLFVRLLLGDDEKESGKPSGKPAPKPPPLTNHLYPGGNSAQNPCIPANSMPTVPEKDVPLPSVNPALKAVLKTPLPSQKKVITREDMATVFHRGASALPRPAAVAALKALGFGKSAAYDALLEDGRFSAWLRFSPGGIITWES
jgi:hypothetical protein